MKENLKDMLIKLDEALPLASSSSTYQKIVASLKKELLKSIKDMEEDEDDPMPGEFKKQLAAINKAKTISQLSNVARDMSWDYESFMSYLVNALGGKEDPKSAMFAPGSWDT
jgi:hypothetical protein